MIVLKINWRQIIDISDIECLEGNAQLWFDFVWKIIYTTYGCSYRTFKEKLAVYRSVWGMLSLYCEFCSKLDSSYAQSESVDFEIDFSDVVICERITLEKINKIIYDSSNLNSVYNILIKYMGIDKLFASLYYAINYDLFSLKDWENDEFYYSSECEYDENYEFRKACISGENESQIYDIILNEMSVEKLNAYIWLSNV